MNEKQLLSYKIVKNVIIKQEQSLRVVNGTAGTGKSFLLGKAYFISLLLNGRIKRCAPRAKAAFLIRESQIDSLFNINNKIDK